MRGSPLSGCTRGEPRTFRKFETPASYLKALGITDFRVHTAEFVTETGDKPGDKRRELASDRMKQAHQAAACDRWFRSQVQASIDDPRPNVPGAEVRATFAAKHEALRARPAGVMPAKSSKAGRPRRARHRAPKPSEGVGVASDGDRRP